MRALRVVLLVIAALIPGFASASLEGAYWDPSQNGEGWTFESQKDIIAGTWYMYEPDGRSSFRVFSGSIVASPQGVFTINATMYQAVSRGNNQLVGNLSGTFSVINGQIRGTVNAAGVVRHLEQFTYAFAEPLDFFHGIWAISLLGINVGDAIAIQFSPNVVPVNGIRTKQFVTAQGAPGAIGFDASTGGYYGLVNLGGGQYYCFSGTSSDDATIGSGYYGTSTCAPTSAAFFNVGKSILNTEGELAAQGQQVRTILGFQFTPPTAAKRAEVSTLISELIRANTIRSQLKKLDALAFAK